MTQLILDASMRSKLHELKQTLELCDESGQVLARLIPVLDPSAYEPLQPQVSDEELLRRSRSDEKTYTTAEVLAHLESL
jgi:hypothetical protein